MLDLDGTVVSGSRRPSTDTPTHLALYRAFEELGGVVHTHSTWATVWAQAQRPIPLLGTTHADLCAYPIPVTRALTAQEIDADYEFATGAALIEAVSGLGPAELPCALVRGHAPFCWGASAAAAVSARSRSRQVARMALLTTMLRPDAPLLDEAVADKHTRASTGRTRTTGSRSGAGRRPRTPRIGELVGIVPTDSPGFASPVPPPRERRVAAALSVGSPRRSAPALGTWSHPAASRA